MPSTGCRYRLLGNIYTYIQDDADVLIYFVSTLRLNRMIHFTDDLEGVSLHWNSIFLNRLVYIGFTLAMDCHYRCAVDKYGCWWPFKSLLTCTRTLGSILIFSTYRLPNWSLLTCYSVFYKIVFGGYASDNEILLPKSEVVFEQNLILLPGRQNVANGVSIAPIDRSFRQFISKQCSFSMSIKVKTWDIDHTAHTYE